ncbi:TonB family protein [Gilvimarinus sp. F26214L]|uniref:TonB family protein n=1 Tax=Gilvimarinus sp. DZF01 TaxID=3461371 RepID=UPI0040462399
MSALTYNQLALAWHPAGERNRFFQFLSVGILALILLIAAVLSSIELPVEERRQRASVPPRVARFIAEAPKPPEPVEKPEPKPLPPPKAEPKPTVKRERPSEAERKPLTEAQKTAREKAQSSGLLALHNELSDLMDTSEIDGMVASGLTSTSGGTEAAAGHEPAAITEGTARGGAGVDSGQYGSQVSSTTLSAREVAAVRSELFAESDDSAERGTASGGGEGDGLRSREDVTIVFDRNKGTLYSLYARERRRSPGLQGKIVLEITIDPSGRVSHVEVLSSELNNPSLESGIVARIKMFKFEPMEVEELTVTYPIEFLPS